MPVLVDTHIHTHLCKHAIGATADYVEAARKLKFKSIIFTDHTPIPGGYNSAVRMEPRELAEYRDAVQNVRRAEQKRQIKGANDAVEVLYGIETDIVPDAEAEAGIRAVLAAEQFDYVLVSLHYHAIEYFEWEQRSNLITDADRVHGYFTLLSEKSEAGLYDAYGHLDLIAMGLSVSDIDPDEYKKPIQDFLAVCRDRGSGIEINTSGMTKPLARCLPHPKILKWAKDFGIKLCVGSDAHSPERIGFGFDAAEEILKSLGVKEIWIWKKRKPEPIGLD